MFQKDHLIYIEGHRGMNREFYENTLKSFAKSIECKLESIEFDVWLTKDKVPVIFHVTQEIFKFAFLKNLK